MPDEKPENAGRSLVQPFAVAWAVVSLAAFVVSLARMTIDRDPVPAAGDANLADLYPFWITSASAWAALSVLWLTLRAAPERASAAFGRTAVIIVAVAIGARVVVLLTHEPALSDDVYRYVFDGANRGVGINPYGVRPEDRVGAPGGEFWPGESATAARVNNREMHTIYLPTSQWVFVLGDAVTPAAVETPLARARVLRAVLVVIELGALGLLVVALRRRGRSAWWLALYAWHPLPVAEIAGSGHQDAIGLVIMLGALLVFDRFPRRTIAWTIPLAAAAMVKPVVIPVAAFLLRRRPWRAWTTALVTGAVACTVIALPMLVEDVGGSIANLRLTASRFSLKWAHFGSVYEPLLAGIERLTPAWGNDPQEQLARTICLGLFGMAVIVIWRRGRDAWTQTTALFLAMVLLSPAVHPWYLLWALALVPVARDSATWVASLTLAWGYAVLGDTLEWTVSGWVMAVAYVPIYVTLGLGLARRRRAPAVHSGP